MGLRGPGFSFPLGKMVGACYNPPTNFSFFPSSGTPSTQPAVLPPQPISTAPAPAPAPPAQPTSSSQPAPLAFNPFLTSHLPLYNVTDFYEPPQGYAQLQQPLGSPHRQPLPPSPDPDAEMSSPTYASSSIDHYGLLQPPSPRDDLMEGTPPSDHLLRSCGLNARLVQTTEASTLKETKESLLIIKTTEWQME